MYSTLWCLILLTLSTSSHFSLYLSNWSTCSLVLWYSIVNRSLGVHKNQLSLSLSLSLTSSLKGIISLSSFLYPWKSTNMSEDKEHRSDDDYSQLGAKSPPPMPPVRAGATFNGPLGVNISLFACRAKYTVIGLLTLLLDWLIVFKN